MELVADKETFGDRGGAGSGAMSCEWGPMKAWVDCDMNSDYEGFGSSETGARVVLGVSVAAILYILTMLILR